MKPLSKKAQAEAEKAEAIQTLRDMLKPGARIYTIQRHRAASGMMRVLDVYVIDSCGEPLRLSWSVATAIGATYNRKHEGIQVGGCGFNAAQHVAMNLSYTLHGYPKDLPNGIGPDGEPWDPRYDTGKPFRAGDTIKYREL